MIDDFSARARQITFAARFKAGERGAKMIDIDDFLVGLVLEDQGLLVESVFSKVLEIKPNFAIGRIWQFPSDQGDDCLTKFHNWSSEHVFRVTGKDA
jgi:hypothetical protein